MFLKSTHNLCYKQKFEKKYQFSEHFQVFGGEIFNIFE